MRYISSSAIAVSYSINVMTKILKSKATALNTVNLDTVAFAMSYCKVDLSDQDLLKMECLFEALRNGYDQLVHDLIWHKQDMNVVLSPKSELVIVYNDGVILPLGCLSQSPNIESQTARKSI